MVEATAPSTASRAGAGRYRLIGRTPAGAVCIACQSADGEVMKIAPTEVGAKAETLHPDCAEQFFKAMSGEKR